VENDGATDRNHAGSGSVNATTAGRVLLAPPLISELVITAMIRTMALLSVVALPGLLACAHHARADSGIERITLMLQGAGCAAVQAQLETAVGRLDGVRAVDDQSVPGHVLIDIEKGRVTAVQLIQRVNDLSTDPPCQAGLMESCITAGRIASQ
jgi:hypothetical protein